MKRIVVIGGGAAGMLAAAEAAAAGCRVTLLEQNEKLGKKLYITGKGRCNVTNNADRDGFFAAVTHNPRFMYSAYAAFDNQDMQRLIESLGVPLKIERGGRVFPVSDKSSDILRALERHVKAAGADVRLNTRADQLVLQNGAVAGVRVGQGTLPADAVIVATGGVSYPQTGSTGDGYRFAEHVGHTVMPQHASLISLTTQEDWPFALSGLTLKNVRLTAKRGKKRLYDAQGELLLTHFGISGPLVLTLSSLIAESPAGVQVSIDLKPALDESQLDARLLRDLEENKQKSIGGALHALLPARLLQTVLELAGIDPAKPVNDFRKEERRRLIEWLKHLPLTVTGTRPIAEAVITRGGVKVSEINSSTMESKLVSGLYFAGEVLDVDAVTGGYNLQIAWSTGVLAGRSASAAEDGNEGRGMGTWQTNV